MNKILAESDAVFKHSKTRFMVQLEDHLKFSVAEMYSPERFARRNKAIDDQLFENMTDPINILGVRQFLEGKTGLEPFKRATFPEHGGSGGQDRV